MEIQLSDAIRGKVVVDPLEKFRLEVESNIRRMGEDHDLRALSRIFTRDSGPYGYAYNFSWLGIPIVQLPQDMIAMQELIWRIRPDLVIETGIAHGGSLILSASMLLFVDYADALKKGEKLDPARPQRKVLGIDIDIRAHNRAAIEIHPMANHIEMIQGSSTDPEIVASVHQRAKGFKRVLVFLDSDHTHKHVLAELKAYSSLVTPGSYCVVFDTLIEDRPPGFFPDRPWDKDNNPKTAVWEFLASNDRFEIDEQIENKLLITSAPSGYLKCVKD